MEEIQDEFSYPIDHVHSYYAEESSNPSNRVVAASVVADNYRKWIRWLKLFAKEHDDVYTPGLGAAFAAMTTIPRTGKFSTQYSRDYHRLVSVFDSYVLTGRMDLSMGKRGQGRGLPKSQEHTTLLTAWSDEIDQRGLAAETRDG